MPAHSGPTPDELVLVCPVIPRRFRPAFHGVAVVVRRGRIDDIADSHPIRLSSGHGWKIVLARRKAQHGVVRGLSGQAALELDHEAGEMQADGLDGAPRAIAGMLNGPSIDA